MATQSVRNAQAPLPIAICAIVLAIAGGIAGYASPHLRDGSGFQTVPHEQADEPAPGSDVAEIAHDQAHRLPSLGVRNLAQVTPTLYRGGQPSIEGWQNLKQMGVDIVVDLRVTGRAHERKVVTGLGMRYVEIAWQCFNPKDTNIARFLAVIHQNPDKKVFVHCNTGIDRTGMEIAAYRVAEQGWTEKQARKEMQDFGFNFLHRRICPRLGAYETSFPKRLEVSPVFQELRAQTAPPGQSPSR